MEKVNGMALSPDLGICYVPFRRLRSRLQSLLPRAMEFRAKYCPGK